MIAAHSIETRVDLITLAMGADGRLIEAAINSGTHGFILKHSAGATPRPQLSMPSPEQRNGAS
ncbi:hypothetical protein VXQ18_01650 [Brucella abortus]|nr:hypothetical protein [Brucella abortus]